MNHSRWLTTILAFFTTIGSAPCQQPVVQPPTPIQSLEATDLPLNYKGATGQLAEWLKGFDAPPQKFSYTIQLLREDDKVRLYQLKFPSPFVSQWPENNVVPCELSLPKTITGKIPAVVVLDILDGRAVFPRMMSRTFAENGMAALYMSVAYYNDRRPKDKAHLKMLETNPERITDGFRQSVMDVRRAKSILASRSETDPRLLGITGVSLGGIITSLAAGVDGEFDRVVPILAGGDLTEVVFCNSRETRRIRELMQRKNIGREQFTGIIAPVEPTNFASRIDAKRCLMINARLDEVIPRAATDSLYKAIGQPRQFWTPLGHYTSALYLPLILQSATDFLSGKEIKPITIDSPVPIAK